MIVINFKTYKTGKKALVLAKKLSKVSKKVIFAVPAPDIYSIAHKVKNPIFTEHVDYFEPNRHTGAILPEDIKSNGAKGSLINHSERKLTLKEIKLTINRCKKLNLKTIVCASNLKEAKKIDKFKPDFIAYEPPELIAGNISVSKAKPDIKDPAAAKIAIATARTNIASVSAVVTTQSEKDYTISRSVGNNAAI